MESTKGNFGRADPMQVPISDRAHLAPRFESEMSKFEI